MRRPGQSAQAVTSCSKRSWPGAVKQGANRCRNDSQDIGASTWGDLQWRPGRARGPELLLGDFSPAAMQRAGRWGDGYIAAPPPGGGVDPASARKLHDMADESWKRAGRPGKPRFVCCAYFALGHRADEGIRAYIGDYYKDLGPALGPKIESIPWTEERARAAIQGFADVGADEVILWPCLAELDQVDRLAALVPQPLRR